MGYVHDTQMSQIIPPQCMGYTVGTFTLTQAAHVWSMNKTAAANTRPEITALAARHISRSPSRASLRLKIGMNAAVSAPSPSRRRNRFGTWKAITNALATQVLPMNAA